MEPNFKKEDVARNPNAEINRDNNNDENLFSPEMDFIEMDFDPGNFLLEDIENSDCDDNCADNVKLDKMPLRDEFLKNRGSLSLFSRGRTNDLSPDIQSTMCRRCLNDPSIVNDIRSFYNHSQNEMSNHESNPTNYDRLSYNISNSRNEFHPDSSSGAISKNSRKNKFNDIDHDKSSNKKFNTCVNIDSNTELRNVNEPNFKNINVPNNEIFSNKYSVCESSSNFRNDGNILENKLPSISNSVESEENDLESVGLSNKYKKFENDLERVGEVNQSKKYKKMENLSSNIKMRNINFPEYNSSSLDADSVGNKCSILPEKVPDITIMAGPNSILICNTGKLKHQSKFFHSSLDRRDSLTQEVPAACSNIRSQSEPFLSNEAMDDVCNPVNYNDGRNNNLGSISAPHRSPMVEKLQFNNIEQLKRSVTFHNQLANPVYDNILDQQSFGMANTPNDISNADNGLEHHRSNLCTENLRIHSNNLNAEAVPISSTGDTVPDVSRNNAAENSNNLNNSNTDNSPIPHVLMTGENNLDTNECNALDDEDSNCHHILVDKGSLPPKSNDPSVDSNTMVEERGATISRPRVEEQVMVWSVQQAQNKAILQTGE